MSDRIDDIASDMQYILQEFTDLEDRFTKLENSIGNQGKADLTARFRRTLILS